MGGVAEGKELLRHVLHRALEGESGATTRQSGRGYRVDHHRDHGSGGTLRGKQEVIALAVAARASRGAVECFPKQFIAEGEGIVMQVQGRRQRGAASPTTMRIASYPASPSSTRGPWTTGPTGTGWSSTSVGRATGRQSPDRGLQWPAPAGVPLATLVPESRRRPGHAGRVAARRQPPAAPRELGQQTLVQFRARVSRAVHPDRSSWSSRGRSAPGARGGAALVVPDLHTAAG